MKIIMSERLQKVELQGELKKTKDNFVYLDVSNDLISGFYSSLCEDAEKPPYNNKSFNNIGAHISVIKSDEYDEGNLSGLKELGKNFSFQLKDLKSVNPQGWDEIKRVWFLQVKSPELEKFRQKYHLSKLIDGHEFHITIAVKEK